MLHIKKNVKLKGMTLIEVIIAMVIIVLVTIIAYIGVSAAANFVKHGTDLRTSDGEAVKNIEDGIRKYNSEGAAVSTYIPYSVEVKESGITLWETPVTGTAEAGVVSGTDSNVEYKIYVPYFTTTTAPPDIP